MDKVLSQHIAANKLKAAALLLERRSARRKNEEEEPPPQFTIDTFELDSALQKGMEKLGYLRFVQVLTQEHMVRESTQATVNREFREQMAVWLPKEELPSGWFPAPPGVMANATIKAAAAGAPPNGNRPVSPTHQLPSTPAPARSRSTREYSGNDTDVAITLGAVATTLAKHQAAEAAASSESSSACGGLDGSDSLLAAPTGSDWIPARRTARFSQPGTGSASVAGSLRMRRRGASSSGSGDQAGKSVLLYDGGGDAAVPGGAGQVGPVSLPAGSQRYTVNLFKMLQSTQQQQQQEVGGGGGGGGYQLLTIPSEEHEGADDSGGDMDSGKNAEAESSSSNCGPVALGTGFRALAEEDPWDGFKPKAPVPAPSFDASSARFSTKSSFRSVSSGGGAFGMLGSTAGTASVHRSASSQASTPRHGSRNLGPASSRPFTRCSSSGATDSCAPATEPSHSRATSASGEEAAPSVASFACCSGPWVSPAPPMDAAPPTTTATRRAPTHRGVLHSHHFRQQQQGQQPSPLQQQQQQPTSNKLLRGSSSRSSLASALGGAGAGMPTPALRMPIRSTSERSQLGAAAASSASALLGTSGSPAASEIGCGPSSPAGSSGRERGTPTRCMLAPVSPRESSAGCRPQQEGAEALELPSGGLCPRPPLSGHPSWSANRCRMAREAAAHVPSPPPELCDGGSGDSGGGSGGGNGGVQMEAEGMGALVSEVAPAMNPTISPALLDVGPLLPSLSPLHELALELEQEAGLPPPSPPPQQQPQPQPPAPAVIAAFRAEATAPSNNNTSPPQFQRPSSARGGSQRSLFTRSRITLCSTPEPRPSDDGSASESSEAHSSAPSPRAGLQGAPRTSLLASADGGAFGTMRRAATQQGQPPLSLPCPGSPTAAAAAAAVSCGMTDAASPTTAEGSGPPSPCQLSGRLSPRQGQQLNNAGAPPAPNRSSSSSSLQPTRLSNPGFSSTNAPASASANNAASVNAANAPTAVATITPLFVRRAPTDASEQPSAALRAFPAAAPRPASACSRVWAVKDDAPPAVMRLEQQQQRTSLARARRNSTTGALFASATEVPEVFGTAMSIRRGTSGGSAASAALVPSRPVAAGAGAGAEERGASGGVSGLSSKVEATSLLFMPNAGNDVRFGVGMLSHQKRGPTPIVKRTLDI
ncbi:hypothetical protein Agub_g6563 [Astrephomene gubernaculifera]|uniref:Uncharacterized protein n=1 Tax=Astrephomene gubernaculifera TaxID=47775 RepID=A0AAD3DNM7_9CHLO|nr:hypothetical protein Agub_g6563 [Astrephomene gubernaculifera]